MSDFSSIPVTRLQVGAVADLRLDGVIGASSSRQEVFVPTLNAARNSFGVPGRLAPPPGPGMRAWIDGTEELRIRLERLGWQVPKQAKLNSAGLVVSADTTTGIALVSGNAATGRAGYSPQVKYTRGRVSAEVVQGSLFDEFVEPSSPMKLWFLLHDISRDGWHAELSLPAGVDKSGWVTSWRERIQIVEDGPGGDEPAVDTTPDLPAPTVRWRESA